MTPFSTSLNDSGSMNVTGDLTMYTIEKDWWKSASRHDLDALKKQSNLTICLSDIARIDSAGLAWLLNLIRDAKRAGLSIKLQNPPKELLNLAKISDASSLLPLE
ncbi:STAS domain-containing protein [Alteromonas facilis]|uniref:STAS domain-containing protein n=1 Tax=Alteromonas facilis TaxID=2048004 RepID=UPI000C29382D|nr:STAS domain-containing protein [Alteromonas facilis]